MEVVRTLNVTLFRKLKTGKNVFLAKGLACAAVSLDKVSLVQARDICLGQDSPVLQVSPHFERPTKVEV